MDKLSINIIAAILSLLLSINISIAQSAETTMPRKELRINLETVMYQKLIETTTNNSGLFSSRDAPSGVLSLSNYYRLKNNFAIEPSVGFTLIPYNYKYSIKLQPSHPMHKNGAAVSHNSTEYGLPSLKVGFFVLQEFDTRSRFKIFTGLGVNLNTYPTYAFRDGVIYSLNDNFPDSSIRFFNLELEDKGYQRAFWSNLTYSGRVGLSRTNSKGNGYSISLVFNFQPNEIGSGNYSFNQGSYLETGSVKWKNSYYGFCFSKTFNRDKKE